jgi:hypothetical protein
MCGTRVDGQPLAPYGQPAPPPPQYAAPAGPPPSKAMAMTGGISGIVMSSLYLLIALLAIIGGAASDEQDTDGAVIGGIVFLVFGLGGVIFGVYAVKGRWWGCMIGGILQSVLGLLLLAAYAGLSEAERKAGVFSEMAADDIGKVKTFILVWLLITVVTAVFNFIGIASAKNWERGHSRSHLRAADQF